MRVIGIDPGLAATGYAIIEADGKYASVCTWGCIRTDSQLSIPHRLSAIHEQISHLLHKWSPEILAIEDIFVKENTAQVAIQVGEVKGVIYLAAYNLKVKIIDIKPTEVKRALTGNGRAKKEQVEKAVRNTLNLQEKVKPNHASDALALALTGVFRAGFSF